MVVVLGLMFITAFADMVLGCSVALLWWPGHTIPAIAVSIFTALYGGWLLGWAFYTVEQIRVERKTWAILRNRTGAVFIGGEEAERSAA